jgi:hypothetical protein
MGHQVTIRSTARGPWRRQGRRVRGHGIGVGVTSWLRRPASRPGGVLVDWRSCRIGDVQGHVGVAWPFSANAHRAARPDNPQDRDDPESRRRAAAGPDVRATCARWHSERVSGDPQEPFVRRSILPARPSASSNRRH